MCEGSGIIKRRTFLEGMFVAGSVAASGGYLWQHRHGPSAPLAGPLRVENELAQMPERHMSRSEIADSVHLEIAQDEAGISLDELLRSTKPDMNLEHLERLADEIREHQRIEQHQKTLAEANEEAYARADYGELAGEYFDRIQHFDREFPGDIILSGEEWETLVATSRRVEAVRNYVGFGNFNILSWDDMLAFARNVSDIGRFTDTELAFMEELFYREASDFGFYGDRIHETPVARISRDDVYKVPRSGHFLLRGDSLDLFNRLQNDIGDSLILTSGVRGIPKQFDLFMAKAKQTEGNLSQASRSLAPPGYSYHAVGDFDVGKYGLGLGNFSEEFAKTSVFRQLVESGYTDIRYTADNEFGVRFEPWHVRAV